MLPFIYHKSFDNIDFVRKPSENLLVDRWVFKVSLPNWDADKLFEVIANDHRCNKSTINMEYIHSHMEASFEVTDYGFSEWLKGFIERQRGWRCTITNVPRSYNKDLYDPYKVTTYRDILSELSGLPKSASDKEHAEAIVKGDNKMSKVKMQPPTYYSSFRKFTKVIRSGPVTVAWIEGKKVMVRKTKKDKDDPEKAMLMLYAKSQFGSEAAFHRWFRDQMDIFKEADKNAKN